ncbi:phytoene desaturase family protein [Luedemannella helvata]|uniref:Phytoene desaturase family protein n=1 Tax=Luedemannella helvata TaxID=349315 RepID=A0ABN2JR12_9ACTN
MSRVVVVGAGVGGLAAAARLARAGHHVTLLERAATVGGKLASYERHTDVGTFRFDTGPSLLTLPDVFAELFATCGADLRERVDLRPLDPVVRHRFADGTWLDSSSDHATFLARIDATLGAGAAGDWDRLWRRAGRVWRASWRDVLTRDLDRPLAAARLAWRLRDLAAIAPGVTLRDAGRRALRDPRLRTLLDRYATYAGADPRRAPAALLAIPYAELAHGGWYVRGGLTRLATALGELCAETGAVVRTHEGVSRIRVDGDRATGVELDGGGFLPADVVVANVDAAHVYGRLLPDRRRAVAHRERSLAGFVLLLGVRGASGLAHHTVTFPERYDAEFDAVFGGRLAEDPAVFVTVADDPAVRPAGHEAWFVLVNAAPHGAVDWRAPGVADRYADRVLAVLAARGIDVRDRLVFRELRTPADLSDATGAPGGAIYGTPAHRLRRPGNRGPVRGLFLVGGSVHPGGGLPMVALGARIVASAIGPAW